MINSKKITAILFVTLMVKKVKELITHLGVAVDSLLNPHPVKIIFIQKSSSSPILAADQVHGCPFKEYNERHLRRLFAEFQLNPYQIEEIIDKTKGKHYQVIFCLISNVVMFLGCLSTILPCYSSQYKGC